MSISNEDAICCRTARTDNWMPPMLIKFSTRERASRGELACTVVMEPLWPVFIA